MAALALLLGRAGSAHAHVVLETKEAPAPGFFKALLLVGHGCDGSATVSIKIAIPEGVVDVKPMPKPGWTLEIEEGDYARPTLTHGHRVTRGVRGLSWTGGPLLDAWSDEFAFTAELPDAPAGTVLYFPVLQRCETGERDWSQTSATATPPFKMPAPALTLTAVAK